MPDGRYELRKSANAWVTRDILYDRVLGEAVAEFYGGNYLLALTVLRAVNEDARREAERHA